MKELEKKMQNESFDVEVQYCDPDVYTIVEWEQISVILIFQVCSNQFGFNQKTKRRKLSIKIESFLLFYIL